MYTNSLSKETCRSNKVKPSANVVLNVLFCVLSAIAIFPVLYVFMISISSEESIRQVGYRLIPESFSNAAYAFLWNERRTIFHATLVSICVTVVGTVIGVFLNTSMGYVLSVRRYKLNRFLKWYTFIPMIFNGGLVASYVIISNVLHLNDTIWALILPLCVSPFYIIICRTFFQMNISGELIDSAKIDGATEWIIYSRIVIPVSKPLFATVSLFLAFGYWNDWFLSSLYITNPDLISLQALLNNIMRSLEYIARNPTAGLSMQQYAASMPSESVRMAIAIIIVIPIACVYPFFQRYFISGMTVGAVKG